MTHTKRRPAFTLTEILVVVAIIALLGALIAAGVFGMIGPSYVRNTEATMHTIYKALSQHWQHVIDEAKKEQISPAVLNRAGGDPKRARVIWIKVRLREAFPVRYNEINATPWVYAGNPPPIPVGQRKYMAHYQVLSQGKTTATNRFTESAACVLFALSVSRGGHAISESEMNSLAKDTDGDGIKELVDGWGNPVEFFRFPTEFAPLQTAYPGQPTDNFRDPLDPHGTLLDPTWLATGNGNWFQTNIHPVLMAANTSKYTIPVLVSTKGNKVTAAANAPFALNDFMQVSNAQVAAESIYSFKLRY